MNPSKIPRLLEKCHAVAKDSPDPNTKVGAILVHKATRSVVAEGFNGFIRGANDPDLPDTAPEKYRYMVHAEANLIYNTFRTGAIKYTPSDYALFCTISPCENCARLIHQCGITEIYVEKIHKSFDTYSYYNGLSNATALDIVGIAIGKKKYYQIDINTRR